MVILGISAFYHDSAAALVRDGKIVSAAQEERFTRKKHYEGFPTLAIKSCLEQAGCEIDEVDFVVFYEKPLLKFERLMETYLSFAPRGFQSFNKASSTWLTSKLFQKAIITKELKALGATKNVKKKILFAGHHQSHAASAYYPSPFNRALVVTMDGVGEWATTTVAIGENEQLQVIKEIKFPHSLGLLYSAFTFYCGFKVNSGEYKLMGLAPYGSPIYADLITEKIVHIASDGSFRLDMSFFDYCTGLKMTNKRFDALFGRSARIPETEPLEQFHMDLASSIQKVLEDVVIQMTTSLAIETGIKNLCLSGGVALNCVANGKLHALGLFEDIWVQPASGDAGGALGAALAVQYQFLGQSRASKRYNDEMQGSYLGPHATKDSTVDLLSEMGAQFSTYSQKEMIEITAKALTAGKAVGWMQGRMEFGPRALGNRSILADPRSPVTQRNLNLKIKFRESFRPFAPSILAEHVDDWFDYDGSSPYMLMVADLLKKHQLEMTDEQRALFGIDKLNVPRSTVPAITHVDYSARLQTVHSETNPIYHSLLQAFFKITGVPMLVNTSFNVRGEPIVCSAEDGFRCFMGTNLDILIVGNHVLLKEEQDPLLAEDYTHMFDLD